MHENAMAVIYVYNYIHYIHILLYKYIFRYRISRRPSRPMLTGFVSFLLHTLSYRVFCFPSPTCDMLVNLPFQPRRGNTSADEVTKSKTCFTVKTEVVPPVSQLHRILRTNVTWIDCLKVRIWRCWQQIFDVQVVSGRFHFGLCVHTSSPGDTERLTWEPESSHPSHGVLRGIRCCQAPPPDVPRNACRWCEGQEGKKRGAWGRSPKTREQDVEDRDEWSLDAVDEADWGHGESHPPPGRLRQARECDGRRAKFWKEGSCW